MDIIKDAHVKSQVVLKDTVNAINMERFVLICVNAVIARTYKSIPTLINLNYLL